MSYCKIKHLANRFLAMNETDMHHVYLIIKDQPLVKEAYEMAKKIREQQKKGSL